MFDKRPHLGLPSGLNDDIILRWGLCHHHIPRSSLLRNFMSLGFDAISTLPFATSTSEGNVAVVVTGNQVSISIGSAGVNADAVT